MEFISSTHGFGFVIYATPICWNRYGVITFNSEYVLQMKTGMVALVLCLNIGVDPPDVIKISPCARLECWIGMTSCFACLV